MGEEEHPDANRGSHHLRREEGHDSQSHKDRQLTSGETPQQMVC